ncbi:MutS-related protein [Brumimicrobium mesophilum]|uniref:MutS-related protein n=1 Tax=Brumimicrobium mesophilum TaxID=392717 RepID=UPI000D140F51|nr:DNA mismatch repair protein MutS [Brumimicrobium mesophilum]
MNWILGILLIFIVIYIISNYKRNKKLKRLESDFKANWGKKKEDEYYDFEKISLYFDNNRHRNDAYHIISDKCKNDLDFNEVFKYIDRTTSKIGQQYLYNRLSTITNVEELNEIEFLVEAFEKDEAIRVKSQMYLSRLNKSESYYLEELINGLQLKKPKTLWLIYVLTAVSILSIFMSFFYPFFILFLIPIFAINVVFHYSNKRNIKFYLRAVNQLSIAHNVSKKLVKLKPIKSYFKDLKFIKEIEKIKFKTEIIRFEKGLDNEFTAIFWSFFELIKILFNIEYIVFYSFIDSIITKRDFIEELYLSIGEIDTAINIASLRSDAISTCKPTFTEEKEIVSKEISHPLVDDCIPNTFNLQSKSMLLTGTNMSGKTTFIRTVAINSVLAQTLNICFAQAYKAPFFKVYSSIRITDDLFENKSYYLEEVLTIRELIENSDNKSPCLFVLDEIFKGTNTIERISGGKAILSYLNKKNHIVLVSTHDIELTELLVEENYKLFHFQETINEKELVFDYKLKQGKLQTRNAIRILELYKYPKLIIDDAMKTEKKLI